MAQGLTSKAYLFTDRTIYRPGAQVKLKGFVRCEIMDKNDDGSLVGWCRVNASRFDEGEDLSVYLLERGWAVALPDAPIEYQAMEKIARSRGFGVWGIQIDRPILRVP